ncbi:MAG: O-antigen ligase family protein [Actinomycetota bacterium]|nr:O-antigen ligase family protein [Actinomycetota bacterium]
METDRRWLERATVHTPVACGLVAAGLAFLGPSTVLTLAVLVPLGVALVRRPQRGLLLLAALVPFDGLLLLLDPVPPLVAGWKEGLVLITLAATFVAPAGARAPRGRPLPAWWPAVAALLSVSLASGVVVGGLQAAWGLKIAFFFLLVALAAWRCPPDARERDRLVTILLVTGVVTAVYGIVQQAMGHDALHHLGYQYNTAIRFTGGFVRSFSTFDNPFGFGYFLMLVLLIVVPHALSEPRRLRSRVVLCCLPVLALGLAASFVRGAWIGLAVGLAYLAWSRFRALALGIPVVAVVLVLLPGAVTSAAFAGSSGVDRVNTWHANLSEIASHPVGVGVGSSNAAAEKVLGAEREDEVFHPDNEYYRALYELGVIGLWLVVLVLAATFGATRKASTRLEPDGSLFALATSATILAAAASGFVTTYFDTFPNDMYFWLLVGSVAALDAGRRRGPVDTAAVHSAG